jgi:hypothetical protein
LSLECIPNKCLANNALINGEGEPSSAEVERGRQQLHCVSQWCYSSDTAFDVSEKYSRRKKEERNIIRVSLTIQRHQRASHNRKWRMPHEFPFSSRRVKGQLKGNLSLHGLNSRALLSVHNSANDRWKNQLNVFCFSFFILSKSNRVRMRGESCCCRIENRSVWFSWLSYIRTTHDQHDYTCVIVARFHLSRVLPFRHIFFFIFCFLQVKMKGVVQIPQQQQSTAQRGWGEWREKGKALAARKYHREQIIIPDSEGTLGWDQQQQCVCSLCIRLLKARRVVKNLLATWDCENWIHSDVGDIQVHNPPLLRKLCSQHFLTRLKRLFWVFVSKPEAIDT